VADFSWIAENHAKIAGIARSRSRAAVDRRLHRVSAPQLLVRTQSGKPTTVAMIICAGAEFCASEMRSNHEEADPEIASLIRVTAASHDAAPI
jgi:hypothetical protein